MRFAVENEAIPEVQFNEYVRRRKTIDIVPKNRNQERYIDLLSNSEKPVVYAVGPAGTGKTILAVLTGIRALREQTIQKLILTRPAIGVEDEKHGFLPGDLNRKMEPWTKPLFDVIGEHYSPKEVARMLEEQVIEISPLAYMRGRNFHKCWIIADEMQNSTVNQMKMLLTRIGDGSKLVVTGDPQQVDRQFVASNGLTDIISRIRSSNPNAFGEVEFFRKDAVRSKACKAALELYGDD